MKAADQPTNKKRRKKKTAVTKNSSSDSTDNETTRRSQALAAIQEIVQRQQEKLTNGGKVDLTGVPPGLLLRQFDISVLADASRPAAVRAEMLLLAANEVGYDIQPQVTEMIERLDEQVALAGKAKALEQALLEAKKEKDAHPLRTEVFLERVERGEGSAAVILTQQGEQVCPIDEEIPHLRSGDRVLVDIPTNVVIDRVGGSPATGEVVTVQSVDLVTKQVTVRKHDLDHTAHLSQAALDDPALAVGASAVWDSTRQIVHRIIAPDVDGRDLLADGESLVGFTVEDLGNPNPVIAEIVAKAKQAVLHPEWVRKLGITHKRSYLFSGPTGTGKSSTIRAIANELADWTEELTGTREHRVVFLDASDFYSPYMGEGEQRIARVFDKLYSLAKETRTSRNGEVIKLPLLVVLEEVEGLIRSRGDQGGSSHLFERMLGLLLQKMDSAAQDLDAPIIFISTSNRKELIDSAAKRRFGDREVYFPYLDASETLAVLEKKIPATLRVGGDADATDGTGLARDAGIRRVLFFLYGDTEDQPVAEVVMRDSSRRSVERRDLVSASVLTSAVDRAKDLAMNESMATSALVSVDPADIVRALDERFRELARGLTPHNLGEHVPELFDGQAAAQVATVQPISRRPSH